MAAYLKDILSKRAERVWISPCNPLRLAEHMTEKSFGDLHHYTQACPTITFLG
jgi:hypothetical protein